MKLNKAMAFVMALVLALYLALALRHALDFFSSGEPIGYAMGAALLVLPLIGVWILFVEVRFGIRLDGLVRRLERADGMPEPLPATPSGRADLDAALEAFPVARDDAKANPESWESWLRLSMAYDAARDRKRARKAARKAIELSKAK
ncbi:hypothetical protein [Agrococcus casei]|uniref:Uncharacterized protein n=1 Tax=Agrococcus casei LMG 22410 TaxID=1255656 RepID=A0A1R4FWK2_9MICO|nr:hypothetical protein [Agrococcus casei]SJM60298.1 hypothetical protein CZ674_07105 [Agrococcus casei LMG 22410]